MAQSAAAVLGTGKMTITVIGSDGLPLTGHDFLAETGPKGITLHGTMGKGWLVLFRIDGHRS